MFPISNIFNWFKEDSFFCIKKKEQSICNLCNLNEIKESFLFPLFPITLESINYKDFKELLHSLYEPNLSACDNCSYDKEQKIKDNIFYHSCKQIIVKEIVLPHLLTFIMDLSTENQEDGAQFTNLILLRDKYKHLIVTDFKIENNIYSLVATCNQKTIDHYTSCIVNNKNELKSLKINKSYYYDGRSEDNSLMKLLLIILSTRIL